MSDDFSSDARASAPHWGSPKATVNLLGYGLLERRVSRLIAVSRLPSALLLVGERGVGKATFAYRIARQVLSGHRSADLKNGTLEGDPETIKLIQNGTHPDLLVVEAGEGEGDGTTASTRGIDVGAIRDVTAFLRKKPRLSPWRIVIIDGMDGVTVQGANALLKTLEEPPLNALLILVAHKEGRLPLTIRSRCHRLYFPPLSLEEIGPEMAARLPHVGAAELVRLMELGEGRPGAILALDARGALAFSDALCALLSKTLRSKTFDWGAAVFALVPGTSSDPTWGLFWELYLWWLAHLMRLDTTPVEVVFQAPEHQAFAKEMLGYLSAEEWCMLYHQVAHIFKQTHLFQVDQKAALLTAFRVLHMPQPAQRIGVPS